MALLDPSRSSFSNYATLRIVPILILILCIPGAVLADDFHHEDGFCPSEAIVDLTNAVENTDGFLAHGGFSFPPSTIKLNATGARLGCICDLKPCLPLCPPPKKMGTQVPEDFVKPLAIPRVYTTNRTFDDEGETRGPEERFHLLIRNPCPGERAYFLQPEIYETDEFYLLRNGSLFLPRLQESKGRFMDLNMYCMRLRPNHSSYTPKVCSPQVEMKNDLLYETHVFAKAKYIVGLVSVPFLVATLIVYSVLPELRNIRGTTLRCYLCCLIMSIIVLAAKRIPSPDLSSGIVCLCLGFTIYASSLASFFWLNVMCFELWRMFRDIERNYRIDGEKLDRGRFLRYSIYAWGIPVVLTLICICMEFSPAVRFSTLDPGFRSNPYWFDGKLTEALYFYGPVSLLIACNVYLFISTSVKVFRCRKKIHCHPDRGLFNENEHWFGLLLKLFVVMGISWSTEIVSWLWEGPKYLWYFTDIVNALQGVLIFLIFVCKMSIWQSLRRRCKGKKPLVVGSELHDYTACDYNEVYTKEGENPSS